ncbi:translation elongation factor 4 [Patescibacteria group bacterium]
MNKHIRNFCIIAHIDHGKSTLADRFLELTETISKREMKEQVLDQMELEREKQITIKLQPVQMDYQSQGQKYSLNLIDTPGHVDFSYEVSRSLAACEGAILLVDATQGIEAQTLANAHLAIEQGLEIIPVVNKIDLPNADPGKRAKELAEFLGIDQKEVLLVSAKKGEGVKEILDRVVEKVPSPEDNSKKPLRALIFDSQFDPYKGVVAYVRVFDGELRSGTELVFKVSTAKIKSLELGVLKPKFVKKGKLSNGEIGYLVTGLKEINQCQVGDTIILDKNLESIKPLPGYEEINPFVYAGFFCKDGDDYPILKDALEKLKLNDAALVFEPEKSKALGFGFRCGFLGLLHLEIIQERLKREFDLDLLITTPSVSYKIKGKSEKIEIIHSPIELPTPDQIIEILEPWVKVEIITPEEYLGRVMELVQDKRGIYENTDYLGEKRVLLKYQMPLAEVIIDFYDQLKSASSGYASMNYILEDYRKTDLVKLEVLIAGDKIEALSQLVYAPKIDRIARNLAKKLKETIPKQMFEVPIQITRNGEIIARETLGAMRKDVTAKLYGGDVSRKQKLLKKQKKGKKKMKEMGKIDLPQEVYWSVLKRK